jgi:hypothetical protein
MDVVLQQFTEKLERNLQGVVERPRVSAKRGNLYKILAQVVSPTFEGMEEHERQEIVWRLVLDTFDQDEQDRIGFLYTDAPSEVDAEGESPEPSPGRTDQR